jgi:hypothetical protein
MQNLQKLIRATEISVSTWMSVVIFTPLSLMMTTGCSDSFMRSTVSDKRGSMVSLQANVDAAGNVTGAFDPSSGATQTLRISSGSLAGAAVAIPPGALSLSLSITVGEGETLAASSFTQQLGLSDNTISAGGPSVSFIPSSNVQASNPFTLSLPLALTSLALDSSSTENLVVMYRWMKVVNGETSYVMGVIPREEVTIAKDKVSFQTDKFGVFQVGIAQTKITQKISVPTVEPPALKGDATNPLVGNWGMCRADGGGSNTATQPPPMQNIPNRRHNYLALARFPNDPQIPPLDILSGIVGESVKALAYHEFGSGASSQRHLYVGGYFTAAGGVASTNRIARLNLTTKRWESIAGTPITDTGTLSAVKAMVVAGQTLYVAGSFTPVNSQGMDRIFQIDLSTADNTPIQISVPTSNCDYISAMKVFAGHLFVACNNESDPNTENRIWRKPLFGSTWTQVGAGFVNSAKIVSLETSGSLLFVGTSTGLVGAVSATANAGTSWPSKTPFSTSEITSMASTNDGHVFVAAKESGNPDNAKVMKIRSIDVTCSGSTTYSLYCSVVGQPTKLTLLSKIWVTKAPTSGQVAVGFNFSGCTVSYNSVAQKTDISCDTPPSPNNMSSSPGDGAYTIVYTAASESSQISELSYPTATLPALGVFGDRLYVGYGYQDPVNSENSFNGVKRYDLNFQPFGEVRVKSSISMTNTLLPTPDGVFIGGSLPNSGCDSLNFHPNAAVNVDIRQNALYKLLVSIDGGALTDAHSGYLSSLGSSYSGITGLASGAFASRTGRTIKIRTPSGCYLESTEAGSTTTNKFSDLDVRLESLTPASGVCTMNYPSNLKIICDGTDGGTNSGGNQTGGKNDSFGAAPGVQYSVREGIKITAGNFLHIMSRFKSTDCTGVMASNLTESGTYTLPTSDDTNSIRINGLTTKVTGSLLSDDSVTAANQTPQFKGCGLNGWVKGTPRDLSTTGCAELKPFYGRFKVDAGKLIICGMGEDSYAPASECAGSNTKIFQKLP